MTLTPRKSKSRPSFVVLWAVLTIEVGLLIFSPAGIQLEVVAINAGSSSLASSSQWRQAVQLLSTACKGNIRRSPGQSRKVLERWNSQRQRFLEWIVKPWEYRVYVCVRTYSMISKWAVRSFLLLCAHLIHQGRIKKAAIKTIKIIRTFMSFQ